MTSKPKYGNLRDKQGRPSYLARLPIYKRYPRIFILGGGIFCGLLPISGQLYDFLFKKEEDIKPYTDWWPSEKARGKRAVDMWREKMQAQKEHKEALEAAKKSSATPGPSSN